MRATLHWVAAPTTVPAEIRLYDYQFVKPDPDDVEPGETYLANLNPNSVRVAGGLLEPSVVDAPPGARHYPPEELVADAASAGLRVDLRAGSYELHPSNDESAVWLLARDA